MKFLIDFKNSTDTTSINSYLHDNQCQIIKNFNNFDKVYLVDSVALPPLTDIVERITADDQVSITPLDLSINSYFGIDNPLHVKETITTEEAAQWWKVYSHDKIDFDQPSFTFTRKGSNVDIYIMDSGIFHTHPEFSDADISFLYSINNTFDDNNGHGTAIASVMVGKTCGITSSKLKIVKIFEQNYTTRQSDLLSAFDAIISDKINNLNRASILNISWCIDKNEYIENKIITLINAGVYVICSAGNSGLPIGNVTPASMNEVITVGSYNQDFQPCDFSSYTPAPGTIGTTNNETNFGELDGWAPGVDIIAAKLDGGTAGVSGTSISAGISSAVMAYNLDDFVHPNSEGIGWQDIPQNVMVSKVFFRVQLLELDESKYALTSNRILTWMINVPYTFKPPQSYIERKIKDNDSMNISLFSPSSIKSVVALDPLPNYIKYSSLGALIVGPRELNEDYVIETYRFEITDNTDQVTSQTVKFIFFKSSIEGTIVTLPDSETPVKLLYTIACSNWNYNAYLNYGCYDPFEIEGCNDNCATVYGSGYYCYLAICPDNKTQDACTCYNPSDERLKTDIEFSHMIKDTKWYKFKFKSNLSESHLGVIAQDLINTKYDHCLNLDVNGYYLVNYCELKKMLQES